MKRIIYTGNFSISWDYYKGMQGWHIKNLWAMYNYAKKHGADFRVIDNSNNKMQWFYNECKRLTHGASDGWSIGTLASFFALQDFVESEYDEFCWLDLDVCIKKTDTNLFNVLKKDCITIENYVVIHDSENPKKTFVQDFMGIGHNRWCGTGMFMMNKETARKTLSFLEKDHMISFSHSFFMGEFIEKLIPFYKQHEGFVTDEHLMEGILNWGVVDYYTPPRKYLAKIIFPGQTADPSDDVWGFHFAGTTKNQIESFPMCIGVNGVPQS